MATLKSTHKEFIVTRLARMDPPSDVRDALKAEHGVDASLDQIVFYNPDTANGAERLSDDWKELFYRTREKFQNDASDEPAYHKAVRIRMLADAAREAQKMKNYVLMQSLLEQIAKETGGKYTNKQLLEHAGRDGGPIQTVNANLDLSDFEDTDDPTELMDLFTERFGSTG